MAFVPVYGFTMSGRAREGHAGGIYACCHDVSIVTTVSIYIHNDTINL